MTPNCMDALPAKSQMALDHEHEHREGRANPNNLRDQIAVKEGLRMWPTPAARDYRSQHAESSEAFIKRLEHKRGVNLVEELQRAGHVGQLNPAWVEWLMGWPVGWTSLEPLKELVEPDWSINPAETGETPRLASKVPARVNRLKAIGNGQVPQCMAEAWRLLSDVDDH